MIVLGIHDGHNASAALMADGLPLAAMSQERFTYRKNDMGFPLEAIEACLKLAGVRPGDVDHVAFSTKDLGVNCLRTKREYSFTIRDWLDEQYEYWRPLLYENRVNHDYLRRVAAKYDQPQHYDFKGVPFALTPEEDVRRLGDIRRETVRRLLGIGPERIQVLDHHACHAHYAYFGSPFRGEDTAVFTADGGGDGANATVSVARGDVLTELARNNVSDLARIYRYITLLLGMKMGEHEFKVMGLAPYASNYEVRKTDKAFKDIFKVSGWLIEYARRPADLFFHFKELLEDCRFDGIAGGVQEMVEQVGRQWFSRALSRLGVRRVVFSGGLSMNVKLNMCIRELEQVDAFYSPASGGDESTALGACYLVHAGNGGGPCRSVENNYLGVSPEPLEIREALARIEGCTVVENADPELVARLLSRGVILGRLHGPMEFGARALGNRSILANPADKGMVRIINEKIKFRDFWMPFAPSILEERAADYLENSRGATSDHMTMVFATTALGREALVAAMHPADFTVRAHIVRRANNPGYHELIRRFEALTGVGALLNTSFNLHGKPIVRTPEQALDVFLHSDLDGMLLADTLVLRKPFAHLA